MVMMMVVMIVMMMMIDRAKPNGLVYIPYQDIQATLHTAPITVIPGVGPSHQQAFSSLGLTTCGQLLTLKEVRWNRIK